MASPLKISARVEIDASQAKQGAASSVSAVDSIGAAAERNTTKVQALINASVGIGGGTANQNVREWTGALAMQGKSLDELRAKYNPLFATISQYKAAQTEIRTLHAQGVLSTNEMTAAIQRQRQAALASIDAIKGRNQALSTMPQGFGAQNHAATSAMFQLQDIGMTAAMGMDPRMIGLQQGTQLAGGFAGMSVKQAAGTMGTAFTQLLSPVSLLAVGLTTATAAGIQYFMTMGDGAEKTTADLEEQNDVIRRAAAYWGEATPAFKSYVDELDRAKRASEGQEAGGIIAGRELEGMGAKLDGLRDKAISAFSALRARPNTADTERELGYAWDELKEKVAAGTATVADFDNAKKALSNAVNQHDIPTLKDFSESVDRVTSSFYRSFEAARKARNSWFNAVSGGTNVQDIVSQATFVDNGKIYQTDQFKPRDPATPERRPLAEIEGLPGDERRLEAQKERLRLLNQNIESQKLELSLIGQTIGEQERLRMEFRLTSELQAEAARSNTTVSAAELERVKALSGEYGRLAEQMVARRALDEQDQEIAALRVRLALTGQTEEVRERAIRHLETERQLREMGLSLGSREAEQYRQKEELIGRQNDQLRKQEAAWDKVRGTAENSIDTVVDKLSEGDWSGGIEDIAKYWKKNLLQLGAANPIKNALLGTNHETLDDIGGLGGMFSKLLGGGMSTGTMSVTAATVSVNGGVAGLPGLTDLKGAAANDNSNVTPLASGAGGPLGFVGNYKSGVDPRLTDILQKASQSFQGYKVDAMSGFRPGDPRFHGKGLATDVQLTDLASGKLLGNYQDAATFGTYERFAQTARAIQMRDYPELADKFRWGGYFGGGKGKYGAVDNMHFDLGGAGMAGGSWEGGLTSAQRALWPGIESKGNAAVAALDSVAKSSSLASEGLGVVGAGMGEFGKDLTNFFPAAPGGGSTPGGAGGLMGSIFGMLFSPQYRIAAGGGIGLYAKGGIADRPSIFGEAGAEAAVPLPDGRTIPVTLNVRQAYQRPQPSMGGMGSARNAPIINNYGSSEVSYEETTDERGNKQPIITVGEQGAAAVRQRGNPMRTAVQQEFGLRSRRIQR